MSRLDYLQNELNSMRDSGLLSRCRVITSPTEPWLVVDGRRVLNLSSNNYLGFANAEETRKAAAAAVAKYGVGSAAGRIIAGTTGLHVELEKKLADFKHAEACVTVATGYLANVSVIPAITSAEDVILSDELNHASIIDACRLSKAKTVRYLHADMADLRQKMSDQEGHCQRMFIVTDGVFSMDGDITPLPEMVELAEKLGAVVIVDDAHGEGVLGDHGRGVVNHFGLDGRVDVEIGTLSKAFGTMGGYVTGSRVLIDYVKQRGRPFVFSSPLTPADTAAVIAAVDAMAASDGRVMRLRRNAEYFQRSLRQAGFDTGTTQTPITPVMVGDEQTAARFSSALYDEGVFAMSLVYPVVARGKARLRCMLSASHEVSDLDLAVDKISKVGRSLGVITK